MSEYTVLPDIKYELSDINDCLCFGFCDILLLLGHLFVEHALARHTEFYRLHICQTFNLYFRNKLEFYIHFYCIMR